MLRTKLRSLLLMFFQEVSVGEKEKKSLRDCKNNDLGTT